MITTERYKNILHPIIITIKDRVILILFIYDNNQSIVLLSVYSIDW